LFFATEFTEEKMKGRMIEKMEGRRIEGWKDRK
jgi:hypothetical protein